MQVSVTIDAAYIRGAVDRRLFSSFIEHLGRGIYGGIYEPGQKTADGDGFRGDVLSLVRELGVPLIRYPGGNYVSSFRWEDSIGPVEKRPRRLDLAWRAVEPNTFGLDEFMKWVKKAGAEPMMAVNLGTRGIEAAADLVEYCNHPGGSYLSDLRIQNGAKEPYHIKTWCLGNEMDGPWQVGQKTPEEYGRIACETAKALKLYDPSIELVACGSSFPEMATFPVWEETVLDRCYDNIDYLSLHQYQNNNAGCRGTYLASSIGMDRFIDTVAAACDLVQAKKRSAKKIYLSFDEWNVWFHSLGKDKGQEPWTVGPHLLEDVYTFDDALVVGCLLNTLIRHADRVKIACLAQLVNVIAPIMTSNGAVWKQTIWWPFYYASHFARGTALDVRVQCPSYADSRYGDVPFVDVSVVRNENTIVVFAVNRSAETAPLSFVLHGFERYTVKRHVEMAGFTADAVNTEQAPNTVYPSEAAGSVLRPYSWNMIELAEQSNTAP